MNETFKYFTAPREDMTGFKGIQTCSVCNEEEECIEMHDYSEDRKFLYRCLKCMQNRSFYIEGGQETEIGLIFKDKLKSYNYDKGDYLDSPLPKGLNYTDLEEFLYTPYPLLYQEFLWSLCHEDFMCYKGRLTHENIESFTDNPEEWLSTHLHKDDESFKNMLLNKNEISGNLHCFKCDKWEIHWDCD
jgi:hypothetical protein